MITPPPVGDGCFPVTKDENAVEFNCGCGLTVHHADLLIHSLSCLHLQPSLRPLHRITDPLVFTNSGLTPPRSLSLRVRRKTKAFNSQAYLYREMSELLDFREDGEQEESHESLSTPPPAVMSFQIDETKPDISHISPNSKHDSEEDEGSQINGILSPSNDENSKTGEDPKDMAAVLDVLFGGETPTVASMPSNPESSGGENSPLAVTALGPISPHTVTALGSISPHTVTALGSISPLAPTALGSVSPPKGDGDGEADTEKDKEESGSEFNSFMDEMLNKDKPNDTPQPSNSSDSPASPPPVTTPTQPPPAPPTIRMRPMLDLMSTNGNVKEEKIEEPFAALNDLVKNLQSTSNSVQPPTSHLLKNDFSPMTSITSHPPPGMMGGASMGSPGMGGPGMGHGMGGPGMGGPGMGGPGHGQVMGGPHGGPSIGGAGLQVSIQKRPAPQSFPPGITMTKQPRRDSESSSSSSQGPSSPKLPEGITLVKPGQKDPVASMLATRGVSVMPSGRENQAVSITKTAPKPSTQILSGSNSALTITATPPKRSRPSPVPVTTVDLTDDTLPPVRRAPVAPPPSMMRPRVPVLSRGRPPAATCDVCDKVFANAEALRVHMQTHTAGRRGIGPPIGGPPRNPLRPPGAIPGGPPGPYPPKPGVFECEVCTARYQTQQQLMQHTQRFHPDRFGGAVGHQFGLPVVNLDDSKTPGMLASLGIRYCIPMVDLQQSNGAPGHYALPVIAMDGSINPAVCNLDHMKCSNLLPLGPMKAIRRQ